jgi:DNA-directed RNA polymerase specialized sigma24 family protein
MSRPEEEHREFVGSRAASLHRAAYLLCGDWHLANDLVQETFVQTFRHWRRVQRADNQNAYVKRILINEFRRHWQRYRELPAARIAENVVTVVGDDVGYTVDLEHMTRHAGDHPQPRTLRRTQVCRREDGEWKVVLRKSRVTWRSDNTWAQSRSCMTGDRTNHVQTFCLRY